MVEAYLDKYCNYCEYYDGKSGICSEIHENVRDYDAKFSKKCGGKLFMKSQEERPELEGDVSGSEENKDSDKESFIQKIAFGMMIIGYIGIFITPFALGTFLWTLLGVSGKASFQVKPLIVFAISGVLGFSLMFLGQYIDEQHKKKTEKN